MGCCQGSLLTSSAELELRNAGVHDRPHLQCLSSIAQDLLGDSYRAGVVAKAQQAGKEELELSTRPDARAGSQAFKCANIVDMTKFENHNVLSWLKVRQENEIRREQIGADEVQRDAAGGLEIGLGRECAAEPPRWCAEDNLQLAPMGWVWSSRRKCSSSAGISDIPSAFWTPHP